MKQILFLFITMVISFQAIGQETDPDLVAYYSFNDCDARDSLGNQSDGVIVGQPDCVCGVSDNALSLDGISDHIIFLGLVNNFFNTGNFSISFYFKSFGIGLPQDMMSKREDCGSDNVFGMTFTPNQNFITATASESATKSSSMTSTLDYSNCWHHVVFVREGGQTRLYFDGILEAEGSTLSRVDLSNNAVFSIGNSPCLGPSLGRFRGYIDELKVFQRALDEDDIEDLYIMPEHISNRDTLIFLGTSVDTRITQSCASNFEWSANSTTPGIQDDTDPTTTLTPSETTTYRLSFLDADGCVSFDTLRVEVIDPSTLPCDEVFLPKAFTPNGDGLNDEYGINNPYVLDNLLAFEIYSRWGERVFYTEDAFELWDGSFRGKTLNPGVFLYKVRFMCDGEERQDIGSLSLLR